MIDDLKLVC